MKLDGGISAVATGGMLDLDMLEHSARGGIVSTGSVTAEDSQIGHGVGTRAMASANKKLAGES